RYCFPYVCALYPRHLCSSPTRRSSDLLANVDADAEAHVAFRRQVGVAVGHQGLHVEAELNGIDDACEFEQEAVAGVFDDASGVRSEEHTSELQSHLKLVCRLLLANKKQTGRAGGGLTGPGHAGLAWYRCEASCCWLQISRSSVWRRVRSEAGGA